MPRKTKSSAYSVKRVLCLGNELMADDAFGQIVARQLEGGHSDAVIYTSAAGFRLMDFVLNVSDLLVIDTIQTGAAKPGTVHVFNEKDLSADPLRGSHFVGLLEILLTGRKLRLPIPNRILIIAVEAADTSTIGGALHPAVQAAVPIVVNMVRGFLAGSTELRKALK